MSMSNIQPVDTKQEEGRAEWTTPSVRRMDAGDAEAGFPGAVQDAPYVNAS